MHFYRLFGLNFQSEFKFPFLNETTELIPDIKILIGKTPDHLENIKNKGVLFQSDDQEFLFWISHIGRYYVKNGNTIIIEKKSDASDKDIYAFMAGSVFGALFQQRNLLAFHGCTVEKNGKSYLFLGKTGSGKSTLAIYLYNRGYNIISDDISIINFVQDHQLTVENGPPYIKIWLDVLNKFKMNRSGLEPLRDHIHKYIFPVKIKENSGYLDRVYVLRNNKKAGIEYHELNGIEKFNALLMNIYKPQFSKSTLFEQKTFMALSALASTLPVETIEKGQDRFYQEQILDYIEKKIY